MSITDYVGRIRTIILLIAANRHGDNGAQQWVTIYVWQGEFVVVYLVTNHKLRRRACCGMDDFVGDIICGAYGPPDPTNITCTGLSSLRRPPAHAVDRDLS